MPSLRDEITRTFFRLGRKTAGRPRGQERSAALPPGTELGPYRVLEQLGEGGMGQVYLASDAHLSRKVALKVLPTELTGNAVFLRRFQQEARTASSLNHPNILTIFDFLETGGHHVIVSEFVEGKTLRDLIERRIELSQALDILAQVASALSAAHEAGVVHRDLKPTNIMVRPDGWVKIIDFGLAKLTQGGNEGGEPWTLPGAVLGTVGYMSPEQARGDEIDGRTDLWSLGVILYEILARSKPFEGASESHVIVAILDESPPAIPDADKLPPGLIQIVNHALAKEKRFRYQNAAALLADLEKVQSEIGTPVRRLRVGRGRPFPFIPAVLAFIVLACAFALWWWPLGGRYKFFGPDWFEIASSRRLTFLGNVQLATISPDGKSLGYVAASHGSETVHLLDLASNAERQLPPTADHYLGITFSPDSKTLFYVLKDMQQEMGRLFSVPVQSVGSEPPGLLLEDLDSAISFSPDGRRFAFFRGHAQGTQDVNELLAGSVDNPRSLSTVVSLAGTSVAGEIAWSPGNQWLALIAYPTRVGLPTVPMVYLYRPGGQLYRRMEVKDVQLRTPVALDGGSLLLFTGMPHQAQQFVLTQLFVPTGESHERAGDILGLDGLSATADGNMLAAVRLDERSSIWVAGKDTLNAPEKMTPDAEKITSLDWLDDNAIVFPSSRSGSVNLAKLDGSDNIGPLSPAEPCRQTEPAVLPGVRTVVYASNCGSEGDDLTIWALDPETAHVRRLTSGSNFDEEPSVSPDGKWVYYTSWSSNIPSVWKAGLSGGAPVRVLPMQARTPVVSPDGKRLVSTVRDSQGRWMVAIASTDDGSILQRLPSMPVRAPLRWSPDATALDYAGEDNISAGIWRQPLKGGPPALLLRVSEGTIPAFAWNRSGTKIAYVRARDQKDAILFTRARKR